jgi:hypothetical protein
VRADDVVVTGTPQFDFHFWPETHWSRQRLCDEIGADPARPLVLYTTGMPNHMPGEPDLVEQLADGLVARGSDAQLVVRVYAKDLTGRFDELRARRRDILFPCVPWEPRWLTPLPEDGELLTNLLLHASVGLNVASTVSLELAMFDHPVVNLGYNPPGVPSSEIDFARYYRFDHYRPVVESGAIEVAGSADDAVTMVLAGIDAPERRHSQRRRLLSDMFADTLDGRSHVRVAQAILDVAGAA